MTSYLPREITARLERAAQSLPVIVLSGMRQTGKSTLLQHERGLTRGRAYKTLDDFATLAASRANPEALLDHPAILDEVQRCPDLMVSIKRMVDAHRQPGRFILSGSANLALLGHVAETLAGRAAYFCLRPMTRREINRKTKAPAFITAFMKHQSLPDGKAVPVKDEEVLRGGLPPACLGPSGDAVEWLRGYVQLYIERDVRQLSNIADLISFLALAQMVALRTSQLLSISELARDVKLSAATAGRYLNLLEASFLIQRIPPFLKNRSARLVKSPKIHMADSGLAAYLAGIANLGPGQDDRLRGALYETYTAQNLLALLEAYLPDARLGFWHEQGRHEVDFVVDVGRQCLAIEVKAGTQWNSHDLSGLRAFVDRTPSCIAGVLAYNGNEAVKLEGKLWAIPLGHLLA